MKKIHFFYLAYKRYEQYNWLMKSLIIVLFFVLMALLFMGEVKMISYVGTPINLAIYVYFIFKRTRHNSYSYVNKNHFVLKLDNKKLGVDATFISDVWLENDQLHIQRINRVDSFNIGHLLPQHIDKLMSLLQDHRPTS